MFQSLKAACFHSLTVAWGYLKVTAGAVLYGIHEYAPVVTDPTVKEALDKVNLPPYVSVGLAVIGVTTVAARLRTVNSPTDENNQIVTKKSRK